MTNQLDFIARKKLTVRQRTTLCSGVGICEQPRGLLCSWQFVLLELLYLLFDPRRIKDSFKSVKSRQRLLSHLQVRLQRVPIWENDSKLKFGVILFIFETPNLMKERRQSLNTYGNTLYKVAWRSEWEASGAMERRSLPRYPTLIELVRGYSPIRSRKTQSLVSKFSVYCNIWWKQSWCWTRTTRKRFRALECGLMPFQNTIMQVELAWFS